MRPLSHLVASVVVITASVLFFTVRLQNERARQEQDLEFNAQLLAESLQVSVEPLLEQGSTGPLNALVERFGNRGRLAGIALFDLHSAVAHTGTLKPYLAAPPKVVTDCLGKNSAAAAFERIESRGFYINVLPLERNGKLSGALATFCDTSYIDTRLAQIWRNNVERTIIQIGLFLVVLLGLRRAVGRPRAQG